MAENAVFSNETGQVMFGSGGNIYKVPYSFGNMIKRASTVSIKIDLGINFSVATILGFMRFLSTRGNKSVFACSSAFPVTAANQIINLATTQAGVFSVRGADGADIDTIDTTIKESTNTAFFSIIHNISQAVNHICLTDSFILTGLRGWSDIGNSLLLLYSRQLSLNEINVIYSNGNGGLPLSLIACEVYMKFDRAEILPIGGIDKVGVRDYSGNNRHGEIMNLPAGTLQEQLDWANANLFVPFIS